MIFALSTALAAPVATRPTTLDVDVTGPLATLVVTRAFRYDGAVPIDTELWFAVPPDAAVDEIVVTIGDRRIASRVVGRGEARQIYVAAANAGHAATLLEQADRDLVVERIANLMPGDDVEVELHLVQTVDRHDGTWELVVPLGIAPRLQDPGGAGPTYVVTGPDADPRSVPVVERVDANVAVHGGHRVQWIESPSHPSWSQVDGDDAALQVEGAPANRDLVVRWATALQDPAASLWVAGDHALLQLEAPAPWARARPPPSDVVLVVDASGTMLGRWPRVVDVVRELLLGLRPDDRFTVLVYADRVGGVAVREPGTPDAIARALGQLEQLPLGGGSDLPLALHLADALPSPPDRPKTVVVVSDGGTDQRVTGIVTRGVVHAVGIGAATNRGALDALAREGGGISVAVHPEDDVASAVLPVVDALAGPVLTDVALDWSVGVTAPAEIPPLYADRVVTVAAEGVVCAPVTVTGLYCGRPFAQVVTPRCDPEDRAVEVTWARMRVDALAGTDPGQAAEIAQRFRIASRYTSFVGVDGAIANPGGLATATTVVANLPGDIEVEGTASRSESLMVMASAEAVNPDDTFRGDVLPDGLLALVPLRPSFRLAASGAPGDLTAAAELVNGVEATELVGGVLGRDPYRFAYALVGWAGAPARIAAGSAVDATTLSGTNNLHGAALIGVQPGSPDGLAAATLSGPLVRDHVWLAGDFGGLQRSVAGVDLDQTSLTARIVAQPNTQQRLDAGGYADQAALAYDGVTVPIGGAHAWVAHTWFASPNVNTRLFGAFTRQRLGAAIRDHAEAQAVLTALSLHGGGTHDLELGASVSRWTWTTAGLTLPTAFAQDSWKPVSNLMIAGGVRVDAGRRWGVDPRLVLSWDPFGARRTKLAAGIGRYVDTARILPDELADPAAPTTDQVHVDLEQQLVPDLAFLVLATATHQRFGFATASELLALPGAPVPTIDRRLGALELGLRKIEAHRWSATLGWRVAAPPADPARLADPDAVLVAGFLDPYRRHTLSASAFWRLPTDPFTASVGGFARWSSGIRGADRWWLDPATVVGAVLAQDLSTRPGAVRLSASVTWAMNDAGSTALPLEAFALLGDRVGPAVERPLQVEVRAGWGF